MAIVCRLLQVVGQTPKSKYIYICIYTVYIHIHTPSVDTWLKPFCPPGAAPQSTTCALSSSRATPPQRSSRVRDFARDRGEPDLRQLFLLVFDLHSGHPDLDWGYSTVSSQGLFVECNGIPASTSASRRRVRGPSRGTMTPSSMTSWCRAYQVCQAANCHNSIWQDRVREGCVCRLCGNAWSKPPHGYAPRSPAP